MSHSQGVDTPGVTESGVGSFLGADPTVSEGDEEQLLKGEDAVLYRRIVANITYVSLGYPQIAYAAKEASRTMAEPNKFDIKKIKRILCYLCNHPTSVYRFDWQDAPTSLTGYTGSAWAGCRSNGGAILNGSHLLLHWSRMQAGVALSSAEAELNASVKMGCDALGIRQFCRELGDELGITIRGDADAAQGILSRKGSGKMKHIEVRLLWFLDQVRGNEVVLENVNISSRCVCASLDSSRRSPAFPMSSSSEWWQ